MDAIAQLGNRLATIDVYRMLDEMFSTAKYKTLVPDFVRERLIDSGTYSTGKVIRTYRAISADENTNYTAFTISEKRRKGQISSHVTLKDSGAFYRSFNLMPKQTYAIIQYDEKEAGWVGER